MIRRPLARLLAVLVLVSACGPAALSAGTAAAAPKQRASFTDVQNSLMCVVCHEALAVARSPEAFSENNYVRNLVLKGETKQQILHQMVEQYGPAVLAKPPVHGFDALVYVIPGAVVAIGIASVLITVPRWRRRTRARVAAQAAAGPDPSTALSDADAQRLDADLARHS